MGFDNDIYSILNDGWNTAITEVVEEETVPIIAKVTFHTNKEPPIPRTRHCHIKAQLKGTLTSDQHDNESDELLGNFIITGYEGLENDSINCFKIIKHLLHTTDSIPAGHYHIDRFEIIEINEYSSYILEGHIFKQITSDEL